MLELNEILILQQMNYYIEINKKLGKLMWRQILDIQLREIQIVFELLSERIGYRVKTIFFLVL